MVDRALRGADELDFVAYAALQREAFAAFLAESGSSNEFMTPEFFRWKYHPAGSEALVAVVSQGGRLLAANGMMPLELRLGEARVRGWQSCDTATLPEARGQGHFQACLDLLGGALGPDELFFGFPNGNSVRGFAKAGWRPLSPVPVWVRPPLVAPWRLSRQVRRIARFGPRQDELAERLTTMGFALIHRGAAYLNWRYLEHPVHRYTCLVHERDGEAQGFAVLRVVRVLGRRLTLVMELWGLSPEVERTLLEHVSVRAASSLTAGVVLLDSGLTLRGALRAGLIAVPRRLLPKQQVLMGRATAGAGAARVLGGPFRVQAGDWDAF